MREIVPSVEMVANCGLFCGACGAYLKEKCLGCAKNEKASWCKIRTCCKEHGYASCADCAEYTDPMQCRKFNNLMSRTIGFILRSNRAACIDQIKNAGMQGHAEIMARERKQTIRL